MKVYRAASETGRVERAAALHARLTALTEAGDPLSLLVELGEAEQAILDSVTPQRDGWGPLEQRLRVALLDAGRAYVARWRDADAAPPIRRTAAAIASLPWGALPTHVTVQPPEGYVTYGLDPTAYANAAAVYVAESGSARAARAVVVGVRSIGTSLSAVVAAVVGSSTSVTVRPRGATGKRRVAADGALAEHVRGALAAGGDALIVDEGPGATGETLACVAAWLHGLGGDAGRIVLFPSRAWGMPLAPEPRRAWFERTRKYVDDRLDARPARIARALGTDPPQDLSAGQWRGVVPGAAQAPANAGHERTKYRARLTDGRRVLIRYAGLGTWGAAAVLRAEALAAAGVGPCVLAVREGFAVHAWAEGRVAPQAAAAAGEATFEEGVTAYLAARAPRFRTGTSARTEPLAAMLAENAAEALGAAPGLPAALDRLRSLPERPAVVADARLPWYEWVQLDRPNGTAPPYFTPYLKADAVDHGDSPRLPGPTDLAWDVAGAAVEFGICGETLTHIVERVARAGADTPAALGAAVEAYRAPYAALCLGEATLAGWEATTAEDRRRLESEAKRYKAALTAALAAAPDVLSPR